MPQAINITEDDIMYAQNILLPQGKTFDEERRTFIKNLSTIDLQAVPGSGKTTALLAKLLIIEKKLPFEDGSGILVLSHTNAAIDEIKHKIQKHCPKLFSYPNFIGTIQSFVNEFLAIPFYCQWKKKKPIRIDSDIFKEQFEYKYPRRLKVGLKKRFGNKYSNFIEELSVRGLELVHFYSRETITIPKAGNNTDTYKKVVEVKKELLNIGILNYNDSYFLAKWYLQDHPFVKLLLQKRFDYVFVDEMQDMDFHQYDLLEKIFFDENRSVTSYQRIGDKNQSIYNGEVKSDNIWNDRNIVLPLNGSQRLTPLLANLVNCFALHRPQGFGIVGLNPGTIKPYILKFSTGTIQNVIPTFLNTIQLLQENNQFPLIPKHPVKVIAWNSDWKTQVEKDKPNKVRLVDYYIDYSKEGHNKKIDYPCLKAYLLYFEKNKNTLEPIRKNILNALLKILRIEEIFDSDNRNYTKKKLIDKIKGMSEIKGDNNYHTFQLNIYNWSFDIIKIRTDEVLNELKNYIPDFLRLFDKQINKSRAFIDKIIQINVEEQRQNQEPSGANNIKFGNLDIEITTVHAVKGQTHSATLYLESSYHGHHESERLQNQFLGQTFNDNRLRHIESVKMAYVGLSRPTDLLCIAIHQDRYNEFFRGINLNEWEIIEVAPVQAQ